MTENIVLHRADDRLAGMHADADAQRQRQRRAEFAVQRLDRAHDVAGGADRRLRRAGGRALQPEHGHEAVAVEGVDAAAMGGDGLRHLVEEAVEQIEQLLRQLPFRQRGEGAEIADDDGQAALAGAALGLGLAHG